MKQYCRYCIYLCTGNGANEVIGWVKDEFIDHEPTILEARKVKE